VNEYARQRRKNPAVGTRLREGRRQSRQKSPELARAQARASYRRHAEKRKASAREYHHQNKEVVKKKSAEYRAKNREKLAAQQLARYREMKPDEKLKRGRRNACQRKRKKLQMEFSLLSGILGSKKPATSSKSSPKPLPKN
jgi:hypothetical protein